MPDFGRFRQWLGRRHAELMFTLTGRNSAGLAQRYLAAQPAVLPGIEARDHLLFLIDSARSDLATATLDLSRVRPARYVWQWLRIARARWRLELIVRAAETVLRAPDAERTTP
jgi:hypothetical protein